MSASKLVALLATVALAGVGVDNAPLGVADAASAESERLRRAFHERRLEAAEPRRRRRYDVVNTSRECARRLRRLALRTERGT